MKTFLLLYRRQDGSENYLTKLCFSREDAEKETLDWCKIGGFVRVELIEV